MKFIPSMLLKQLFNRGSLQNTARGVEFVMKNRLTDVTVLEIGQLFIAGNEIDRDKIWLDLGDEGHLKVVDVSKEKPFSFPLRKVFAVVCDIDDLKEGKHEVELTIKTKGYGTLKLNANGSISNTPEVHNKIPRDEIDDFAPEIITERQQFIEEHAGIKLEHIQHYSFDPHITAGNCEHFTGVAQVPIGLAGPLQVNGEHAKGEFFVPLATAEGTLVASYNRGMKILNLSGGVMCTVQDDVMQRAPVFVFEDARGATHFVAWMKKNEKEIAKQAEATTSVGKLKYIDPFLASKFAFLRFNFTTGDAAGQNMVGRATFAACSWILDNYKKYEIKRFYLESNLATDKKASQVNVMHTRGKRVTAECTVPKEVLRQHMRVEPENLAYHNQVANIGAILSGANNNGLHSANGITAMFIATGQDVANVSESSAGIFHGELTKEGDFYISITIPSLIVATYGGGTGLATQKECLDIMDCYGKDKVNKLTEIIAGVVLAGEISLGSAISSSDWVSSHEHYGRNR